MPSLALTHSLDLSAILLGGQSFCWNEVAPGRFAGWIQAQPVHLQVLDGSVHWDNPSLSPDHIRHYLTLDLDFASIIKAFPSHDPHLAEARRTHPGLRVVREDPWECLANFICSSLKQISQIRQINARLRTSLGGPARLFPSPQILAKAGEKALRDCALGYRARHLAAAAKIIAQHPSILSIPDTLPTPEAAARLESLPGVGPKISRCVLLYAYGRWDAFPIDVWVDRLLRELYFPRRRRPFRPQELEHWSLDHFGPHRGLAQLLLFHWFRTRPGARQKKRRLRDKKPHG